MGFDAGQVGPDEDIRRVLRGYSHLNSINNILDQRREMLRSFSGIDRMLRRFGGIDQMARESSIRSQGLRLARATVGPSFVHTSGAGVYADFAKIGRNLAGVSHFSRLQSDALRYGKMFGNLGLSSSIAQTLKLQGIAASYNADWRLRIVRSFHAPALQSILKSSATFGPIVVSPDDKAPPSNYHPDLQEWLIPETATDAGDAIDVEGLVNVVFAYALGIAQHHRTRAFVTVVGKHGGAFLIRVAENTVAGLLVYWILSR